LYVEDWLRGFNAEMERKDLFLAGFRRSAGRVRITPQVGY